MDDRPHFIVAVDFGMTYTGVAYVNLTRGPHVHYIRRWPGRAQANENKVPTVIVYDKETSEISSWGFDSERPLEQNSKDREYCDWFKTLLDAKQYRHLKSKDPEAVPKSQEEVDQWTEDYLRLLYKPVKTKLCSELPPDTAWDRTLIDFIFSVPTTWSTQTVQKFKTLISQAGWDTYRAHNVIIGLTEAEAAAVYVACEASILFDEQDNLLVCDAGGGTTDLNIMKVNGTRRGVPSLKQLITVKGQAIGSTQIDHAFEEHAQRRLKRANENQPMLHSRFKTPLDMEDVAWSMMKSAHFQNAKCCYGSPDDADFRVPIPDLEYTYNNEEHGIKDGHMSFTLSELRIFFDQQVNLLYKVVDEQLDTFAKQYPSEEITHFVLSGGLGNSLYVQERLRRRYETTPSSQLRVHISPEPQLAVCKGICFDRIGRLESGRSVLSWRCARASYGTDCKILYDPKNDEHLNKAVIRDEHDGKLYINNGVVWFIKKGTPINVDEPIEQCFQRKIKKNTPRERWHFSDKVITSDLNADSLPITYGGFQARQLCKLDFDLTEADETKFKKKNRHWWNVKEPYMRLDYEVKVIIGAADITFELWFDGKKLSKDKPIHVEWIQMSEVEPDLQREADDVPVLLELGQLNGLKGSLPSQTGGFRSSVSIFSPKSNR